ncbi:hypothetical protein K438DRAFT_2092878 [Mycena galopus ATCC 62051]|nr:hypothetical protein K438DRAFT_2092878 [Mycena galopus ATCC 62051]
MVLRTLTYGCVASSTLPPPNQPLPLSIALISHPAPQLQRIVPRTATHTAPTPISAPAPPPSYPPPLPALDAENDHAFSCVGALPLPLRMSMMMPASSAAATPTGPSCCYVRSASGAEGGEERVHAHRPVSSGRRVEEAILRPAHEGRAQGGGDLKFLGGGEGGAARREGVSVCTRNEEEKSRQERPTRNASVRGHARLSAFPAEGEYKERKRERMKRVRPQLSVACDTAAKNITSAALVYSVALQRTRLILRNPKKNDPIARCVRRAVKYTPRKEQEENPSRWARAPFLVGRVPYPFLFPVPTPYTRGKSVSRSRSAAHHAPVFQSLTELLFPDQTRTYPAPRVDLLLSTPLPAGYLSAPRNHTSATASRSCCPPGSTRTGASRRAGRRRPPSALPFAEPPFAQADADMLRKHSSSKEIEIESKWNRNNTHLNPSYSFKSWKERGKAGGGRREVERRGSGAPPLATSFNGISHEKRLCVLDAIDFVYADAAQRQRHSLASHIGCRTLDAANAQGAARTTRPAPLQHIEVERARTTTQRNARKLRKLEGARAGGRRLTALGLTKVGEGGSTHAQI